MEGWIPTIKDTHTPESSNLCARRVSRCRRMDELGMKAGPATNVTTEHQLLQQIRLGYRAGWVRLVGGGANKESCRRAQFEGQSVHFRCKGGIYCDITPSMKDLSLLLITSPCCQFRPCLSAAPTPCSGSWPCSLHWNSVVLFVSRLDRERR